MEKGNDILQVKARLGDQVKRFEIKKGLRFTDLFAVICGLFERGFEIIKYVDEEGDLVTLSSEEFQEAVSKVVPKTGGILKLVLMPKAETFSQEEATEERMLLEGQQKSGTESQSIAKDNGFPRKRHISDKKTPVKEKHGRNNVEYYTSLSAALKKESKETGSNTTKEPLKVFLPPTEVNTNEYKPAFEVIDNFGRQLSKTEPCGTAQEKEVKTKVDFKKAKLIKRSEGAKPKIAPSKGKKKKPRRRSRSSSSGSSSSSSGSSSSGSSSSSDGTSSSSGSSSGTDSSGSSSSSHTDVAEEGGREGSRRKLTQHKRRQRKRHEARRIARQLTDYIAPEVCDEVAHCMHHFKKDLKQSMAKKIVGTIEDTITRAFKKSIVYRADAASEEKDATEEAEVSPDCQEGEVFHKDITCDGCERDIFGIRYKCGNCPDFDLCQACEATEGIHDITHVFLKIRVPAVNAGRRNRAGHMRTLLRDNIYTNRKADKKAETEKKASDFKVPGFDIGLSKEPAVDVMASEEPVTKQIDVRETEVANLVKLAPARSVSSDSVPSKDEEVCAALNGLKIAQSVSAEEAKSDVEELASSVEAVGNMIASEQVKDTYTLKEECLYEDDVVVVNHSHAAASLSQVTTPDLVDFDAESVSSNCSEDFIVVPKYFDINLPLDEQTVREHRHNCKGNHCCPAVRNFNEVIDESKSNKMPMDLVASSLPKSRSQPDIAPTQNLMDYDLGDLVLPPPVIAEQPAKKESEMPPLVPITSQPTANVVKPDKVEIEQPKAPVLYGRGVAPRKNYEEPSCLLLRLNKEQDTLAAATIPAETAAGQTMAITATVRKSTVITDGCVVSDGARVTDKVVQDGSPAFNPPAERFVRQQIEYKERLKSPSHAPTWSPISMGVETTNEDGSVKQAFAEYLTDIVDATASAVTAVGGAVSNALKPINDLPKVHFQQETVNIARNDDTEIPRPLQLPFEAPTDNLEHQKPAMSAANILHEMGFFDQPRNEKLLKKHQGDLEKCVNELLSDNNWHSNRH